MSITFQLLIKGIGCPQFFKMLRCCDYPANKCNIPILVGILSLISRINFMLRYVEHKIRFITLRYNIEYLFNNSDAVNSILSL